MVLFSILEHNQVWAHVEHKDNTKKKLKTHNFAVLFANLMILNVFIRTLDSIILSARLYMVCGAVALPAFRGYCLFDVDERLGVLFLPF